MKSFHTLSGKLSLLLSLAAVLILVNLALVQHSHQNTLYATKLLTLAQQLNQQTHQLTAAAPPKDQQQLLQQLNMGLKAFAEGGLFSTTEDLILRDIPEPVSLLASRALELLARNAPAKQSELTYYTTGIQQQLQSLVITRKASAQLTLYILAGADLLVLLGIYLFIGRKQLSQLKQIEDKLLYSKEPLQLSEFPKDEWGALAFKHRQLQEQVWRVANHLQHMGDGKLDHVLKNESSDADDVLYTALQHMQNKLLLVAEEDRQRAWIAQGLGRFVELLRLHEDNLKLLSDAIIKELVLYLGANQGALYLSESCSEQDTVLKLSACFAYNKKKWLEQEILPGEGMLGQCFLERFTWHLTDVPKSYINITSGLGDAPPTAVLLVPLLLNQDTLGVLELAGFTPFSPYQISFVEKLAEAIAATIKSVRSKLHTRKLLEETQMVTEHLQAQEEELRQNMEELQATQEELNRKMAESERLQSELSARMQALDASALLSESDIWGNITYVNSKFCEVAKYQPEEVLGKPHNILRHPDNPKELFQDMWTQLKAGKIYKGRYPNKAKDGSTYWVDATIVPVLNEEGKPIRYIGVRFDITQQVLREREAQKLLSQSKEQAQLLEQREQALQENIQEMQAQEEELRQNMEELQAIQESLQEKVTENQQIQAELEARILALNESAILSETDRFGTITYVNKKFCQVAQWSHEEVVGMPHNIIRHPDTPKEVFAELWRTVKAGKTFKGRYPNLAKDGSTYWVDATIVPVLDHEGKPEKYIGIRYLLPNSQDHEIRIEQAISLFQ